MFTPSLTGIVRSASFVSPAAAAGSTSAAPTAATIILTLTGASVADRTGSVPPMPTLTRDGDVFVLDIGDDENRFHPDRMTTVSGLLDEVAAVDGPRALVTTATGKFFSNGLDLDWLGANSDQVAPYVHQVHALFARVLAFPAPTVAALQGHTFAAGAMLALAHDWRHMRADRGYFCLPEADINIPFTEGMTALIQAKLSPAAATDAMVTARRYGGQDALEHGLVDAVGDEDTLLADAVERARPLAAKNGPTMETIKQRMYARELEVLLDTSGNPFA
jgi:enoyl-CoA hydratase/carnithine racemase